MGRRRKKKQKEEEQEEEDKGDDTVKQGPAGSVGTWGPATGWISNVPT